MFITKTIYDNLMKNEKNHKWDILRNIASKVISYVIIID